MVTITHIYFSHLAIGNAICYTTTTTKKKLISDEQIPAEPQPVSCILMGPTCSLLAKKVKFESGQPDGESFWTSPGARRGSSYPLAPHSLTLAWLQCLP